MDVIRYFSLWSMLWLTGCVSVPSTPNLANNWFMPPLVVNHIDATHTNTHKHKTNTLENSLTVWQQLKNRQQFYIPTNNRIEQELNNYLTAPTQLYRLAERSEPYIYWVILQLQRRNLPIELALLPMVESGFNPLAVSSAKATGLWQFIPLTAVEYGLKFNRWYDPRRELFESTEAALNLLVYLNKQFNGDWLLTLAAYNAGEGRVKRAMQFNTIQRRPTHFWALKLPTETMNYVPRLLALMKIFCQSEKYNFPLPIFSRDNQLKPIEIPISLNLAKIAELSELPIHQVKAYNAAHILNQVYPTKGSNRILLPQKQIDTFMLNLKRVYSVHATTVTLPTETQPHTLNPTITSNLYAKILDKEVRFYQELNAPYTTAHHRIKKGDSLYTIARQYKVKLHDLLSWNKIADSNKIRPGELLTIYTKK